MSPNVPRLAPGGPGIEPRWTRGAKVGVGTAYSTSSRVWYTLDYGCVTEVYYPTIDSPQIRDLRRGFGDERLRKLHHAYKVLLASKLNTSQAIAKLRAEADVGEDVEMLIRFVESSERGVIK